MSDEKDKKPHHPETFFLPPLKMFLAFLNKEPHQTEKDAAGAAEKQEKATEKDVEKLIEKLSEKDEEE